MMTSREANPKRGTTRGVALAVVGGAALVAIVAAAVLTRPWGWSDPEISVPTPAVESLEPPLAKAIRETVEEVRARPDAAESWGRLAILYDVHEHYPEAIACYRRAKALDPAEFRWPYLLGHCLFIGDQSAALDEFEIAEDLRGDYAPLHVYLGRGLLFVDDVDGAAHHFERAASLDPGLIRAHLGLAEVALARGDAGRALAHLQDAVALEPTTGEVNWLLAEANRRSGNLDEAERYLQLVPEEKRLEPMPDAIREAVALKSGVTAHWRRVRTERALQSGNVDAAIEEWESALGDAPDWVVARLELGKIYTLTGQSGKAMEQYRRVLNVEPDNPKAHADLANELVRTGQPDEAVRHYERVLEIDADAHSVRNILGTLLVGRGDTERGLALLQESCAAMPDNALGHFNLAMALKQLNRPQEALAAYEHVLAILPGHVRARFEYGLTLGRLDRIDEAITQLRRVIALDPKQRSAYTNLARALHLAGDDVEAVQVIRDGIAALPGDVVLENRLAWTLSTSPDARARNGDEALAIILPLCERSEFRDPTLLDTLAAAYAETGDFPSAIENVQRAIARLDAPSASQAPTGAQAAYLSALRERLASYERQEPHRETAAADDARDDSES